MHESCLVQQASLLRLKLGGLRSLCSHTLSCYPVAPRPSHLLFRFAGFPLRVFRGFVARRLVHHLVCFMVGPLAQPCNRL